MRKSWLFFFSAHSKKQYEIAYSKFSCVSYMQDVSSEIILRPHYNFGACISTKPKPQTLVWEVPENKYLCLYRESHRGNKIRLFASLCLQRTACICISGQQPAQDHHPAPCLCELNWIGWQSVEEAFRSTVTKTRRISYTIDYTNLNTFGMQQESTGPIKVEGLTVKFQTWDLKNICKLSQLGTDFS